MELFDSMHTEPGYTIKEQACTILRCDQSLLTIRVVNVQSHQGGGDNCGLFAVAMAFDLCEGRDPFLCLYDETSMRSHLKDCFEQESITRLPQDEVKARRRKRIIKQVDVELFCIRRYPDVDVTSHFGDMACCQRCKLWCHAVCMKHVHGVIPLNDDEMKIKILTEMFSRNKVENGYVQSVLTSDGVLCVCCT